MKHLLLLCLLALALTSCPAQEIEGRYYMVGSFESATALPDSGFLVTLATQSDQSGNGYLATEIVEGMRVFTSTRKMYTVDSVRSQTFSSAVLELLPVGTTASAPNGIGMVYAYDGTAQTLPVPPVNSTGISAAMAGVILTHNAKVSGEGFTLDYGRIRFVNKTLGNNATARIGDPQRPWRDPVTAAYDEDMRPGDVIYTYDSYYQRSELGLNPLGNPQIDNPGDSVIFHFERTTVEGVKNDLKFLFNVNLNPVVRQPVLRDSSQYTVTIKGNLNLVNMGVMVAWSIVNGTTGENTKTRLKAHVSISDSQTTDDASNGSRILSHDGSNAEFYFTANRIIRPKSEIFWVCRSSMSSIKAKNKTFKAEIKEVILRQESNVPALLEINNKQQPDSLHLDIEVDQVIYTYRDSSKLESANNMGHTARLVSFNRGSIFRNSYANIDIGTIRYEKLRKAPYFGQGAKDYSDVTYVNATPGEESRMVRIAGDLTGSTLKFSCELCAVEDGMYLIDAPTGGGALFIEGNYRSLQQSVVKFADASNSLNTWLNGTFIAERSPAISSGATAGTSVNPVRLMGTYITNSPDFPAITLNRHARIVQAYIERPFSSGTRPAIESNTSGTLLNYGNIWYSGAGSTLGPNFTASALKGPLD